MAARRTRSPVPLPPPRAAWRPADAPPALAAWPEPERRAMLARWNAERDRVAVEVQDADPGSARRQDAKALLDHLDAIRASLDAGPVSAVRLSTLERRLAEFRQGLRVAAALRPYRRRPGDPRIQPAWQPRVLDVRREHPKWPFPQLWDHLVDIARKGDDDVLHEAVTGEDDRRACDEIIGRPCSAGDHLHWRDGQDRLHSLAQVTVRHYVPRPPPA
jgi:hypothetical protein